MSKSIISEGKTTQEAIEKGLKELKVSKDKVDVKVKFPDNYHAENLAGKDAVFAVEVKAIRQPKEIEINDEFAKSTFRLYLCRSLTTNLR